MKVNGPAASLRCVTTHVAATSSAIIMLLMHQSASRTIARCQLLEPSPHRSSLPRLISSPPHRPDPAPPPPPPTPTHPATLLVSCLTTCRVCTCAGSCLIRGVPSYLRNLEARPRSWPAPPPPPPPPRACESSASALEPTRSSCTHTLDLVLNEELHDSLAGRVHDVLLVAAGGAARLVEELQGSLA